MTLPPKMPKMNREQRDYQNRSDWWYVFAGFVMGLFVAAMICH